MSASTRDGALAAARGAGDELPEERLTPGLVLEALETQARVLYALIMRETKTRYGNHKIGFLWALIEPALTVTVFVAIFSAVRHDQPGGMPLVPFMIVGFVCYGLFRDPMMQMQGAIGQSRALLAFPQVTTFDVILARGILESAVSLLVLALLLYLAWLLGHDIRVERPLGVLVVCALLALYGLGGGFLFSSLEPLVPSIKQFTTQALGRPLFFSSGLFYTADSIPRPVRDYLLWNPLLHMIELARGEFFHEFETRHGSWFYASAWAAGTLALGLVVHRAMRKKAVIAR